MVALVEEVYVDFYMNLLGFVMKRYNYLTRVLTMEEDFYGLEFTNMIFGLQSAHNKNCTNMMRLLSGQLK